MRRRRKEMWGGAANKWLEVLQGDVGCLRKETWGNKGSCRKDAWGGAVRRSREEPQGNMGEETVGGSMNNGRRHGKEGGEGTTRKL